MGIMILRYGVVSRAAPGVAAEDAFDAEPAAFENPVFEYCLHHILAARRRVTAGRRRERGDKDPVEIDGEEEHLAEHDFPRVIGLGGRVIGHGFS